MKLNMQDWSRIEDMYKSEYRQHNVGWRCEVWHDEMVLWCDFLKCNKSQKYLCSTKSLLIYFFIRSATVKSSSISKSSLRSAPIKYKFNIMLGIQYIIQ